jgi:hypothetical protein
MVVTGGLSKPNSLMAPTCMVNVMPDRRFGKVNVVSVGKYSKTRLFGPFTSTSYPSIGVPPSLVGGFHDNVMEVLVCPVTVTSCTAEGAAGAVAFTVSVSLESVLVGVPLPETASSREVTVAVPATKFDGCGSGALLTNAKYDPDVPSH